MEKLKKKLNYLAEKFFFILGFALLCAGYYWFINYTNYSGEVECRMGELGKFTYEVSDEQLYDVVNFCRSLAPKKCKEWRAKYWDSLVTDEISPEQYVSFRPKGCSGWSGDPEST